jgi:hypothetical protein
VLDVAGELLVDRVVDRLLERRAERPQERRLAGALGHQDREGVVDGERRHDEGDAREQDQGLLEGLMVLPLGLLFQLASQLGTGQRLDTSGEHGVEAADQLGLAHTRPGRPAAERVAVGADNAAGVATRRFPVPGQTE